MKPIIYILIGWITTTLVLIAAFWIAVLYLIIEAKHEIELIDPTTGPIYTR